jgi:hypothetical protein
MTFMERVVPVVDATIRALGKKSFVVDPIAGVRYSRATSIVSSAYKRHGRILEVALRESLRESNRHSVWHDSRFRVSREADALASTQDLDACQKSTLPYGHSTRRRRYGRGHLRYGYRRTRQCVVHHIRWSFDCGVRQER